jgi:hypothetical protein
VITKKGDAYVLEGVLLRPFLLVNKFPAVTAAVSRLRDRCPLERSYHGSSLHDVL